MFVVLLGEVNHGSPTFWWVMAAIGTIEILTCAVLAYRARGGRSPRYPRYMRGFYGFIAWTGLCVLRLMLLR